MSGGRGTSTNSKKKGAPPAGMPPPPKYLDEHNLLNTTTLVPICSMVDVQSLNWDDNQVNEHYNPFVQEIKPILVGSAISVPLVEGAKTANNIVSTHRNSDYHVEDKALIPRRMADFDYEYELTNKDLEHVAELSTQFPSIPKKELETAMERSINLLENHSFINAVVQYQNKLLKNDALKKRMNKQSTSGGAGTKKSKSKGASRSSAAAQPVVPPLTAASLTPLMTIKEEAKSEPPTAAQVKAEIAAGDVLVKQEPPFASSQQQPATSKAELAALRRRRESVQGSGPASPTSQLAIAMDAVLSSAPTPPASLSRPQSATSVLPSGVSPRGVSVISNNTGVPSVGLTPTRSGLAAMVANAAARLTTKVQPVAQQPGGALGGGSSSSIHSQQQQLLQAPPPPSAASSASSGVGGGAQASSVSSVAANGVGGQQAGARSTKNNNISATDGDVAMGGAESPLSLDSSSLSAVPDDSSTAGGADRRKRVRLASGASSTEGQAVTHSTGGEKKRRGVSVDASEVDEDEDEGTLDDDLVSSTVRGGANSGAVSEQGDFDESEDAVDDEDGGDLDGEEEDMDDLDGEENEDEEEEEDLDGGDFDGEDEEEEGGDDDADGDDEADEEDGDEDEDMNDGRSTPRNKGKGGGKGGEKAGVGRGDGKASASSTASAALRGRLSPQRLGAPACTSSSTTAASTSEPRRYHHSYGASLPSTLKDLAESLKFTQHANDTSGSAAHNHAHTSGGKPPPTADSTAATPAPQAAAATTEQPTRGRINPSAAAMNALLAQVHQQTTARLNHMTVPKMIPLSTPSASTNSTALKTPSGANNNLNTSTGGSSATSLAPGAASTASASKETVLVPAPTLPYQYSCPPYFPQPPAISDPWPYHLPCAIRGGRESSKTQSHIPSESYLIEQLRLDPLLAALPTELLKAFHTYWRSRRDAVKHPLKRSFWPLPTTEWLFKSNNPLAQSAQMGKYSHASLDDSELGFGIPRPRRSTRMLLSMSAKLAGEGESPRWARGESPSLGPDGMPRRKEKRKSPRASSNKPKPAVTAASLAARQNQQELLKISRHLSTPAPAGGLSTSPAASALTIPLHAQIAAGVSPQCSSRQAWAMREPLVEVGVFSLSAYTPGCSHAANAKLLPPTLPSPALLSAAAPSSMAGSSMKGPNNMGGMMIPSSPAVFGNGINALNVNNNSNNSNMQSNSNPTDASAAPSGSSKKEAPPVYAVRVTPLPPGNLSKMLEIAGLPSDGADAPAPPVVPANQLGLNAYGVWQPIQPPPPADEVVNVSFTFSATGYEAMRFMSKMALHSNTNQAEAELYDARRRALCFGCQQKQHEKEMREKENIAAALAAAAANAGAGISSRSKAQQAQLAASSALAAMSQNLAAIKGEEPPSASLPPPTPGAPPSAVPFGVTVCHQCGQLAAGPEDYNWADDSCKGSIMNSDLEDSEDEPAAFWLEVGTVALNVNRGKADPSTLASCPRRFRRTRRHRVGSVAGTPTASTAGVYGFGDNTPRFTARAERAANAALSAAMPTPYGTMDIDADPPTGVVSRRRAAATTSFTSPPSVGDDSVMSPSNHPTAPPSESRKKSGAGRKKSSSAANAEKTPAPLPHSSSTPALGENHAAAGGDAGPSVSLPPTVVTDNSMNTVTVAAAKKKSSAGSKASHDSKSRNSEPSTPTARNNNNTSSNSLHPSTTPAPQHPQQHGGSSSMSSEGSLNFPAVPSHAHMQLVQAQAAANNAAAVAALRSQQQQQQQQNGSMGSPHATPSLHPFMAAALAAQSGSPLPLSLAQAQAQAAQAFSVHSPTPAQGSQSKLASPTLPPPRHPLAGLSDMAIASAMLGAQAQAVAAARAASSSPSPMLSPHMPRPVGGVMQGVPMPPSAASAFLAHAQAVQQHVAQQAQQQQQQQQANQQQQQQQQAANQQQQQQQGSSGSGNQQGNSSQQQQQQAGSPLSHPQIAALMSAAGVRPPHIIVNPRSMHGLDSKSAAHAHAVAVAAQHHAQAQAQAQAHNQRNLSVRTAPSPQVVAAQAAAAAAVYSSQYSQHAAAVQHAQQQWMQQQFPTSPSPPPQVQLPSSRAVGASAGGELVKDEANGDIEMNPAPAQ